ncbi:MAG: MoaD/ThiS family protein [Polyangiaceae bacterium]
MARVELTRHLFEFFPQLAGKELVVEAATVADAVAEVEKLAPGFAFYVCDELGRLRQHVNIFIDEDRLCDRRRLSDPVNDASRVLIMQALSGG